MSLADRTQSTLQFVLNWQRVRMLGQLSLLNRLAFTLLVVVPLITAFWPAMNKTTEKYNGVVESASDLVFLNSPPTAVRAAQSGAELPENESLAVESPKAELLEAESLEAESPEVGPLPVVPADGAVESRSDFGQSAWDAYLESKVQLVETRFANLMTAMFPRPVETPLLPRTWALGFFAALAILIGDTVMQLFCPSKVRYQCAIEFVDGRAATYSAAPSQALLDKCADRLLDSNAPARELASQERDWQTRYRASTGKLDASLQSIQSQLESQDVDPMSADAGQLREHASYLSDRLADLRATDSVSNNAAIHRRVSIVRGGSELIYRDLSVKKPFAILASLLSYLAGGYCIVTILYEQSHNVARAAGW